MPGIRREFVPNQVFIGLPWKNVRARYERAINKLEKKYPIHFVIVGRDDGQDADDLFVLIKDRIAASSYAIFDATGGNANVSLEYGYADGIEVPRAIFLSTHKAAQSSDGSPIISDLSGKRRVHYKTEKGLLSELDKFCRSHSYTVRFEKALSTALRNYTKGNKKSARSLAIKRVHGIDGRDEVRRPELVQTLQAENYADAAIEGMLHDLHGAGVIKCSMGRHSRVSVA